MPEREPMEELDRVIGSALAGQTTTLTADPELQALARIARELRDLPAEGFKERLKAELQRRTAMTASTSAPAGFKTITPFIIHAQAPELVEFIKTTFKAEELKRNTAGEAYGFYAETRIGDSVIMIGGGTAARYGNLPSALHVYVDDCDAAYRRALAAGAVTLNNREPADQPYGERNASVKDTFGNYWYIATRLGPDAAPARGGSVLPYAHPSNARKYIDFLTRAFGAQEIAVYENSGGGVMHATVRMGDAVLEMGEPDDRTGLPTNGFFVFVDDVDAAYARAIGAGATAVRPPDDLPYGTRSGIVRDPEGYLWWPARWLA
jgi:uncharacterized glyoxalase superfamily protein PhnB